MGNPSWKDLTMDTTDTWEQKESIMDGISAALAYVEDQLEDLRGLMVDEDDPDAPE